LRSLPKVRKPLRSGLPPCLAGTSTPRT